jgi:peptide/nickel transport system substrate-binding protein/oligopeptide transport system substrate-binding protein
MNWKTPPFDDIRMRQAFALAINKQQIAEKILLGTVIPSNHIVPEGNPGYNPGLLGPDGTQNVIGNPTLANELATSYAFDTCHGHLSQCPPVIFTYTTNLQGAADEAQAYLQYWQVAMPGYPIKLLVEDYQTMVNQLNAQQVQFWQSGWIPDFPDPWDWLSDQFAPDSLYNNGSVVLPQADTLMAKADAEQDTAQRLQDYAAAEQLLVTQVAWAPIDQQKFAYLVRPHVKYFSYDAEILTALDVWETVYIAKS